MRKTLIGVLSLLVFGVVAGGGLLQAGVIDVSADTPHSPLTYRLIEWARERSIDHHSRDIVPPADLSAAARIRRGAGNYDAMCASCHLSPGAGDSELRKGLYPQPPDLSLSTAGAGESGRADARRFWIIKHGIKASAMPAWAKAGLADEDIWDLIAFLKILPGLSMEQYRHRVASSEGHSHRGMVVQPHPVPETGTGHDAQPH